MTNEKWAPAKDYENTYEVSNMGRVRSLDRLVPTNDRFGNKSSRKVRGKVLNCYLDAAGYKRADLKDGKKRTNQLVHRLVAFAFVENKHSKPHVNHKNGVKTDNSPENLEWCTHQENMAHAYATGLSKRKILGRGDKSIASKLTEKQVRVIKRRIISGESCGLIAKDYPVGDSAIWEIKAGRSWGHVA